MFLLHLIVLKLPLLSLEPSCAQGKTQLEETRNLSRTQQSALEPVYLNSGFRCKKLIYIIQTRHLV